jgi:Type II secretion system (T2SS), protein M subtype b
MKLSATLLRLFAVSLVCLPLMALAWSLYAYFLHYGSRNETILAQRHILGKLEARIARADEIDRLIEIQKSGETSKFFFIAPSAPLVIAQVQQHLQSIVAANQAQFVRATEIPSSERNGISFAGLKLELSGNVESLAKTVETIESAVPLLFVERARFTGDPMNGVDPHRQPLLTLSLDVVGATLPASVAQTSQAEEK